MLRVNFCANIDMKCVRVEAAKKEFLRTVGLLSLAQIDKLVLRSHLVVRFALVFSKAVARLDVDLQRD